MEFYTVFSLALATAIVSVCSSSSIGAGSYTDTLLRGAGRFNNKVRARPFVGATGFDRGDCNCPLGTICDWEFGTRRCVPTNGIGVVDTGYGASGFGTGRGTIGSSGRARGLNRGFGSNFGASNYCGYLAPECRAARRDFNAVYKYTFDNTLNRCVRVSVCTTCATLNSPEDNLFNSYHQCARFCQ